MGQSELVKLINDKVIGKIVPCHTATEHWYKFVDTGTLVKSVTTHNVMDKPWLIRWAIKQGYEWLQKNKDKPEYEHLDGMLTAYESVRDDAGRVGNVGHEVIENYSLKWIKTGNKPRDIRTFIPKGSDARVWAVARSAEKIFNDTGAVPIASEILVGVEKYHSAGTLDLLVLMPDGTIELWDWKTTNNIHDEYSMQAAAYKKFFEEMTGLTIDNCKVVHLSKDRDDYDVYVIPNLEMSFEKFLSNVDLSLWKDKPSTEKIYKHVNSIDI